MRTVPHIRWREAILDSLDSSCDQLVVRAYKVSQKYAFNLDKPASTELLDLECI